jgi:hypothetical protein
MLYDPTGISGKRKPPSAAVPTVRVRFVVKDVAVTFAPATAPPLGSVTVPTIVPVGSAAKARADTRVIRRHVQINLPGIGPPAFFLA